MNVRTLPTRVDKAPVVKAVFLGWVRDLAAEAGYFAAIVTHVPDKDGTGQAYEVHLLRALGLDKPWLRIESRRDLSNGAANALFAEYEKKAEWPEKSTA